MRVRKSVVLLVGLITLAGCSSGRTELGTVGSNRIVPVAGNELPPPTRSDQTIVNPPYLIGPYDKLTVSVFGIEELADRVVQADGAGKVSFPLVGTVDAAGKTPAELSDALAQGLRKYIRDPQVTVNLQEAVSQVVTVDGEVEQPGLYPVVGQLTLSGAVAAAQGTTDFAKLSDVVVFRQVGGQQMVALYNLEAIRRGNYVDPQIYAGDRVVVGDSPTRRLFKDIAPLITAPLIYLLR